MVKHKFRLFLILPFVAFPFRASAKESRYELSFSQAGKRLTWTHTLRAGGAISERLSISSSNRMQSTLTKTARKDRWQDSNHANLSINYPYSEKIVLGVRISLTKSSDNLYYKEPIKTQSFSSTLSYKPFESLSFSQSVGQSFDRRSGHGESGLSYSLSATIRPRFPERLSGSLSFSKSGNSLRRRDLNTSLSGRLGYDLSEEMKTAFSFSESRHRQFYYTRGPEEELENRFSVHRQINAKFDLKPGSNFKLSSALRYSLDKVDDTANDDPSSPKFQTNKIGNSLEFSIDLSTDLFGVDLTWGLRSKREKDDYERSSLDRQTGSLSMTSALGYRRETSSFSISGLISKSRLNTPDPQEINDRDDFRSNLKLLYRRDLRNDLNLSISASTDQNHSVYINAERSANNRRTKRYSLSPRLEYRPSEALTVSQNFDLSADYINYDFDMFLNPDNPRSNVRRTMSIANSFNMRLTNRIGLTFGYTFKLGDYGTLYSGRRQGVAEDEKEHLANLSLSYSREGFSFSPRYSYRLRKTWGHKGGIPGREIRQLKRKSTYQSFSLSISYGELSLSGTRTVSKTYRRKPYISNTVSVRFAHTF
ncbi:MAG TPA: hypothetical protein EYP53_08940 [Candidatus Latescibacteria bacterium]|nr:hypothetical protein [Candidatus Latescibacterota bacterium]